MTTTLSLSGDWQDRAACKNADPDIFEVNENSHQQNVNNELALSYCRRCEVVEECGAWGNQTGSIGMIYGGVRRGSKRPLGQTVTIQVSKTPRFCQRCHGLFSPINNAQRYCRDSCRWAAKQARQGQRPAGQGVAA